MRCCASSLEGHAGTLWEGRDLGMKSPDLLDKEKTRQRALRVRAKDIVPFERWKVRRFRQGNRLILWGMFPAPGEHILLLLFTLPIIHKYFTLFCSACVYITCHPSFCLKLALVVFGLRRHTLKVSQWKKITHSVPKSSLRMPEKIFLLMFLWGEGLEKENFIVVVGRGVSKLINSFHSLNNWFLLKT